MRVFLVPVANRPECSAALKAAFDLAQRIGSSVEGCHIRPHSHSKVALPEDLGNVVTDEEIWQTLSRGKNSKKTTIDARKLFEAVAAQYEYEVVSKAQATPAALWLEKVGSPEKLLSIHGPVSDLIVVSRPAAKKSNLARLFMLSAVMSTSRPVLIVPPKQSAPIGRHVAIGWNRSPEAAASVAAAMPLLRQAESVTIIRGGPQTGVGPTSAQLVNYLKFWGVKAKRVTSSKKLDDRLGLITAYRDADADLLVIGAYSRSRLRQRLFGGVTEHMLHKASIPVLMKHH